MVLNLSTKNVVKEKYISEQINKNVSIIQLIYSKSFDKNEEIVDIRKKIRRLYTVNSFFNVDEKQLDRIINSKIFKDTFVKISMNIINSIKDNSDCPIFNIDDYNYIVDNNIDRVLDEINIDVLKNNKETIVKILKDIYDNHFDDIPHTKDVKKYIKGYNIIHFVTNENIRIILIILDIICLITLILIEYNISVLLTLSKIIICCTGMFIITNIIVYTYSMSFINEWSFIKHIINYYNNTIIYYEIIFNTFLILFIITYKIIKAYKEKISL